MIARRAPDRAATPRPARRSAAALGLAACLALGACAPGGDLAPLPPAASTRYLLGPGDQIRIITFGEDGLSEIFRVNDAGNVAVPLLGAVHAAGLTPDALGARLAGDLKSRDLLRTPSVSVEITEYRPVYVLGEVTRPGQYTYQPGMTALSIIAIAGGYTYRAYDPYEAVTRRTRGKTVTGRADPNVKLLPGDIVTVLQRFF